MSTSASLELNEIIRKMLPYCSFSLGKEHLENTEPSFDPLVIRRNLSYVKEALEAVRKYGPMPFYGIRDMREALNAAAKGRALTGNDLAGVIRLIQGFRSLMSYERSLIDVPHDSLKDLTGTIAVHDHLEKYLSRCINDYGEVMDSASDELRSVRASLRRIDQEIAAAAQRFVAAHQDSVVDSIITYRAGRAVILVRASDKNSFGGLVYGDSASGQASYIEPAPLVAVNNRKQELLQREKTETDRILLECSHECGKYSHELTANIETCGILDEIFAKAQWGNAMEACAAELCEEKKIILKRARHPLIDPQKVVANNYRIEDPCRLLLITGPNTGGKTVSMKVIGLAVIMTYCGMPVCCDEAVLPLFDRVFVDIGDDQSVVSSLSSFSAHIRKQAEVCREATENSLVLLDEVGSGTDPREGESLAIAILNDLREKGCMTVATTHYGRLKAYGKRHKDILTASVQFDMEKLMPTYRYIEGLTGSSNALEVAERYGLPEGIVKYARFLKNQAKTEEDILIERLEKQLNEVTEKEEALSRALADAEKEAEKLRQEKNRFEKEKDEWRAKAESEAEEYLEERKKEADRILEQLRKQPDVKYHEAIRMRHELSELSEKPENVIEPDENHEYKPHDAVELRSSGRVCEVVSVEKKNIRILLNGREMRVRRDQIRPSSHVIPKTKNTTSVNIASHTIYSTMSTECNLIGMRVDEAMERMDEYMDQAQLYGLKTFRIIHGDGTGRLRTAVQNRLKNNHNVKEFRIGMPNEGGTGATVVVMK